MSFTRQVTPFGSDYDRLAIGLGDEGHVVEMAALVQIKNNLEAQIELQEQAWVQRQTDFNAAMGFSAKPIAVTRVDPKNYYIGARPSLIASPIEFWPSITARCADARPRRQQYDTTSLFDVDLYIEILCFAGPVSPDRLHMDEGIGAEGDVNEQVHLLSSAVQMTIQQDPTLGGFVQTIENPPTIKTSLPFAAAGIDRERTGDYFLYIGRQHRYVIQKLSY